MRGSTSGLLTGLLMLTALQAVVSSSHATGRLGTMLSGAGTIVNHMTSPDIPAIPDLRLVAATHGAARSTVIPAVLVTTPRLPPIAAPTLVTPGQNI